MNTEELKQTIPSKLKKWFQIIKIINQEIQIIIQTNNTLYW